jgi:hypothetical protein
MPGNIQDGFSGRAMPSSRRTVFAELRECVQLQAQSHDATTERSQVAQTSRKTFSSRRRG